MGFDLLIVEHTARHRVHQQHFTRVKALFFQNMFGRDIQHSHLGGQNQTSVVRDIIAGGPQAVAVQHRADLVAVGKYDGGRPVPGLHHGGVILIEIPHLPGQGCVACPGLRYGGHDGQRQVHPAHLQKFQSIVQHRRVGSGHIDHRKHLG